MQQKDLKPAKDFAVQFGVKTVILRKRFIISGIYAILNIATNKMYIGSAVCVGERLHSHRKKLRTNNHPNKHLQSAWNKYEETNFEFGLIETVNNKEELLTREKYWIDYTHCTDREYGYNVRSMPNSNLGLKFSSEAIRKRSEALKGHTWNRGRKHSAEAKLKMSLSKKGKKHSPEHIEKRIAYKRKPDKWPHGYVCKCKPCMKLKSLAVIERRKFLERQIKFTNLNNEIMI